MAPAHSLTSQKRTTSLTHLLNKKKLEVSNLLFGKKLEVVASIGKKTTCTFHCFLFNKGNQTQGVTPHFLVSVRVPEKLRELDPKALPTSRRRLLAPEEAKIG